MSFVDFSAHAVNPLASGAAAAAASAAAAPSEGGFTFDDALDIVNPLQHLPVVSTLYRAITGDQIKTFPKIAGDALYGGVLGFAGSLADSIFEKVTGKSVGDTALAMVENAITPSDTAVADAAPQPVAVTPSVIDTTATAVASNAPALAAPASVTPAALDTIVVPGQEALLSALSRNGVAPDVALRAADAYRRTIAVAGAAANDALSAPPLRASLVE